MTFVFCCAIFFLFPAMKFKFMQARVRMTARVLGLWGVYSNTQHLCAMKAPLFGKIPFKQ